MNNIRFFSLALSALSLLGGCSNSEPDLQAIYDDGFQISITTEGIVKTDENRIILVDASEARFYDSELQEVDPYEFVIGESYVLNHFYRDALWPETYKVEYVFELID